MGIKLGCASKIGSLSSVPVMMASAKSSAVAATAFNGVDMSAFPEQVQRTFSETMYGPEGVPVKELDGLLQEARDRIIELRSGVINATPVEASMAPFVASLPIPGSRDEVQMYPAKQTGPFEATLEFL